MLILMTCLAAAAAHPVSGRALTRPTAIPLSQWDARISSREIAILSGELAFTDWFSVELASIPALDELALFSTFFAEGSVLDVRARASLTPWLHVGVSPGVRYIGGYYLFSRSEIEIVPQAMVTVGEGRRWISLAGGAVLQPWLVAEQTHPQYREARAAPLLSLSGSATLSRRLGVAAEIPLLSGGTAVHDMWGLALAVRWERFSLDAGVLTDLSSGILPFLDLSWYPGRAAEGEE